MNRHDYDFDHAPEISTALAWTYTLIVFALGIGAGLLLRGRL